ncbi:MAG TPA: hypothetical protein VM535_00565 [Candidatus Saccharimonadales bacterium]|nr:hypothetical protein [Candidatus Saccharimonadales bacterium]
MDFTTRSTQPQSAGPNPAASAPKKSPSDRTKWARIGFASAIAAVVILLVALVAVISFGGAKSESKYVDTSRLQAVFLNTGQVYFGNIKALNNNYFILTNIYYLQAANTGSSNSTSKASSSVTLVKLGCELHEPYDQMVINSDQVTFWENLQDNGQVAKAVSTFEKQNPNGQKCADQSSSAGTNSTNAAQNANTNSSSTNSTNSTSNSSANSTNSGR